MVAKSHQRGFTLLELAIVLVIIGIILGAIFKGQELINNAKTKRLLNDAKGLASMQYTFFDRYGRFAGDCNGDGVIDYTTLNATVSNFAVPLTPGLCYNAGNPQAQDDPKYQLQELSAAKLIAVTNGADAVRHGFNGIIYTAQNTVGTVPYNVIVITNVPCFAAKNIDTAIDNSVDGTKGAIRQNAATPVTEWGCTDENQTVSLLYYFDRIPPN